MILERCGESVTENMALLLGRWTRGHRHLEWGGYSAAWLALICRILSENALLCDCPGVVFRDLLPHPLKKNKQKTPK